jgi:hypothetical protein
MALHACAAPGWLEGLNSQLARFTAMPSTVIRRFDYSTATRRLTVEFVSGRRYVYSEVPLEDV